jgi:Tfp pilus assembly protein PilO
MRTLERQQVIIIAIAVTLGVGFVALRYKPLINRSVAIKNATNTQMIENLNIKKQTQSLLLLMAKKNKLDAQVGNYDAKVPQARKFAEIFQQVTDVMNQHGLKNQRIQPGTEIIADDIASIPVNMQCTGNLDQIFNMFKSIEDFQRVFRVDTISFSSDGNDPGQVTVDAKASIYYQTKGRQTI